MMVNNDARSPYVRFKRGLVDDYVEGNEMY